MSETKGKWEDNKKHLVDCTLEFLLDANDAIFEEAIRRMRTDPTQKARLDAYNAAVTVEMQGEMDVDEFNDLETAYYRDTLGPAMKAIAKEVLQAAIVGVDSPEYV